ADLVEGDGDDDAWPGFLDLGDGIDKPLEHEVSGHEQQRHYEGGGVQAASPQLIDEPGQVDQPQGDVAPRQARDDGEQVKDDAGEGEEHQPEHDPKKPMNEDISSLLFGHPWSSPLSADSYSTRTPALSAISLPTPSCSCETHSMNPDLYFPSTHSPV